MFLNTYGFSTKIYDTKKYSEVLETGITNKRLLTVDSILKITSFNL